MRDLRGGIILLILSVSVASAAQILLKLSANQSHSSRIREYLNPLVISGYGMMLLSTVLTMLGLRTVPLSWSPLIESLSYVFISVMGWCILKEHFTRRKLAGLGLILLGVFMFWAFS